MGIDPHVQKKEEEVIKMDAHKYFKSYYSKNRSSKITLLQFCYWATILLGIGLFMWNSYSWWIFVQHLKLTHSSVLSIKESIRSQNGAFLSLHTRHYLKQMD